MPGSPLDHKQSRARSRYPKRSPLLNMSDLYEVHPFYLLRLHLHLGCSCEHCGQVPKVHILSGHGCCSLQPLHTFNPPSAVITQHEPCLLDSTYRTRIHGLLLVSLWLLPRMAKHSNLDTADSLCSCLARRYHASPCADHIVPLGHADCRPG